MCSSDLHVHSSSRAYSVLNGKQYSHPTPPFPLIESALDLVFYEVPESCSLSSWDTPLSQIITKRLIGNKGAKFYFYRLIILINA